MMTKKQPPKPRAKNQKRGLESQDRIIEAAVSLLARHGALGVTHRAVADEAGVSLALTTYHFASKEDILRKVYEHLYQEEARRFAETYKRPAGSDRNEIIDHISTQVIREATEFRQQSIAGGELMLEAFRSKELSGPVKRVLDEKLAFWRETMEELESKAPELDAQIMFCSTLGAFVIMMARDRVQAEISGTRRKIKFDFDALS